MRNILFFLLLSAVVFRGFGEKSGDNTGKGGQEGAGSSIDARLEYMQEGINALWEKIDALQRENNDLWGEINALKSEPRENSGTRDDSFFVTAPQTTVPPPQISNGSNGRNPAEEPEPGSGGGSGGKLILALYITVVVSGVLLVICIVLYIYTRRQDTRKKDRAPSKEKWDSSRQDSNFSSYGPSGASRPASSLSRFGGGKTGDVPPPAEGPDKNEADYWPRRERPTAAPERPPDEISPLYRSREKRDKRRNDGPGDMFLDVNRSVLERLGQGERIQPVLERSGTRLSAQFVLVDNKLLYPNFHIYNETNGLSKGNSNVLSMIYNLKGKGLPGFVESCMPAIVSPRGDTFAVTQKGDLKIR